MKIIAALKVKYKMADLGASFRQIRSKWSSVLKDIFTSSGDYSYKKQFLAKYLPELYERHAAEKEANCAFCTNLVRSSCHLYCLKCRAGTYIHCSPLLPGVLQYGDRQAASQDSSAVPWFFKRTCGSFERLAKNKYARNFKVPFSWITVYNFEVLEGLAEGRCAGKKPCHVCTSVDYEIYKRCAAKKGFDETAPCSKIYSEIVSSFYL